jgi:hypothetical protein
MNIDSLGEFLIAAHFSVRSVACYLRAKCSVNHNVI